ncbi:transmembrane anterior posterior transformation protein 1 homolog [Saccostrea echinata]|uniref:transmembrane anterior posterior transformation protein 1 homolog n=1 Tax=Saccostrea echinata TaxID=191078 RepID=UPI002A83FADB|nr:transmembrane anterior posterior transformation protein 1 homolog [Saccostrea echinata]
MKNTEKNIDSLEGAGDAAAEKEVETKQTRMSVMSFITTELTRGYLLERDKAKFSERRQRVYTFMKTPRELEKFIVYGFFQCLDAFLFYFTFLPVRILLALLKILTHPCGVLIPRYEVLEPAQICDILKGVILVVCFLIVNYIDTSMMYHLVRGQAVIKLYVFYNMLDMADKLFSSFGQDILDSLFWTATEPKDRKREHIGVLPHLVMAIIYVVIHTLLILFQATVLLVAFNSHNKALLTVMMSNNFVEIKGSLFKKIDKGFLYHISCSDVKERFLYIVLLGIVFIRNMTEFSWDPQHVWVILPDAVLVFVAEILVDWMKHAFILKFNEISADVYHSFSIRLAEDMVANRQSRAFIDYSDLVSRRMGFTPIPLAVLLMRICTKSFKVSGYTGAGLLVLLYLCLMTFKVFISIVLLGKAYTLLEEKEKMEMEEKHKFYKEHYTIDQHSLDKFDQVYQKASIGKMKTKVPQCMESNLSQSIPNIHEKCAETELRKCDSVMELPLSRHKKVNLHSDILEEGSSNNHSNMKENDLSTLPKQDEEILESGVEEVLESSVDQTVRKRIKTECIGERVSSTEDDTRCTPSRERLISTESTV